MASAPLARDRFERPIDLPEAASGFLVCKVPSAGGGRPRPWPSESDQLEIQLETTEERFRELIEEHPEGGVGSYRLDVADTDGRPLGVSCWFKLKVEKEGKRGPAPRTALESAVIDILQQNRETLKVLAESNRELARANAYATAGRRGSPAPIPPLDEESPSAIKQFLAEALDRLPPSGDGEEEKELSAEDHIKRAQVVKAYGEAVFALFTPENAGKAMQLIQFLKSTFGKAALPPNGAAS